MNRVAIPLTAEKEESGKVYVEIQYVSKINEYGATAIVKSLGRGDPHLLQWAQTELTGFYEDECFNTMVHFCKRKDCPMRLTDYDEIKLYHVCKWRLLPAALASKKTTGDPAASSARAPPRGGV